MKSSTKEIRDNVRQGERRGYSSAFNYVINEIVCHSVNANRFYIDWHATAHQVVLTKARQSNAVGDIGLSTLELLDFLSMH